MSWLYHLGEPASMYRDSRYGGEQTELQSALGQSTTLYVGNLSFYTTEEQIYELFSKCGEIKRVIMGLDRLKKTPCGFCFVEYYRREDAQACIDCISGTRLDDRVVRCDWDAGFKEGRQYGRGRNGGQVRDELRMDYDAGRGGYGIQRGQELEQERAKKKPRVDDGAGTGTSATGDASKVDKPVDKNPRFREDKSDSEDERD